VSTLENRRLSSEDLKYGQRLIRRFAAINGVSVALLLDSMLILYAIQNGVGDVAVAVLASFVHAAMPLVLVGKAMIARVGAARTWGFGWLFRSLSAGILVLAPFVPPEMPQALKTSIILLGAFGFAAFRAIGLVGDSPLLGEITTKESRGSFLSGNLVRTTTTQLLTLVIVIVLLRNAAATWVYQLVIGIGAALGVYAGMLLSRVPESEEPRQSARKPLREVLERVWSVPRMRKLLFAWAAGFAAFTLVVPFALVTIKNGYGLSDHRALGFTLVALFGGTVSGLVNGIIADRVGPRPLLIIYVLALSAVALFWSLAPERLFVIPTGVAFFVAGYCKFGILMVSGHYFLSVSGASDRVGGSVVLRALSGAIAGLVGSLLAGGVLALLGVIGYTGIQTYRIYFRVVLGAFAVIVPVVYSLERLDEWPLKNAALLHFRPRRILGMRPRGPKTHDHGQRAE
jgi:hypothetical protein